MNCLEFRRQLLIDPFQKDEAFMQHFSECASCAEEAQRAWQFEETLRQAAFAEPSPGLESRVLLADSMDKRRMPPAALGWAMAAALTLAVGLSGWFGMHSTSLEAAPLQTVVLQHIEDEADHLVDNRNVQPASLKPLLAEFGARLNGNLGQIRYGGRCHIRKHAGVHLVLNGREGPVTVLLMPKEPVPAERNFSSSRFNGVIVPTAYGSMAVVGEKSEPLRQTVNKLHDAIVQAT